MAGMLGFAAATTGCTRTRPSRRSDTAGTAGEGGARVSVDHRPGFAIRARGGGVELGLVDDSVYIAVADSVVTAERRSDGPRTRVPAGGAETIARTLRGAIGSTFRRRVARPLRDIRTAEYGGGVIRFHYRRRREPAFEDVSSRRGNALASFRPEDARRFVAAVDSAIATLHAGP